MGVREDFFCDDFKTVPVPNLNADFEYEEINCGGYDLNGVLRLHDLVDCEGSYECILLDSESSGDYSEDPIDDDEFEQFRKPTSTTRCGIDPLLFSHCSQCKICTPIDATSIQVRNLRLIIFFQNQCTLTTADSR